ncbi:oligosaccharyl transferase, archaeosortase A system-associated [Haloplanus rubicundus]|uniref:dolichyl-phosphooligosaccharide-protein glycotransferase n=1 Tax=Haloplanus rubicundus TaxID=1547898 RepID=A0A345E681_9EURY|nr:oligosaccharyl transferase, archaeosortase A system-associated [Haloplanus rubicundus]AXG07703.1 oligosaccharyl transferase, archaeosortase A system-associated [Haloplanus rubicundus]AXG11122.1 oligosaccharyl transferase, archaeosortase A system-associated [Haloplanus rubicundus]
MSDDQRQGSSSVVDLFFDWYHVPALVLVVAAMLAIRLQQYGSFVRDGAVYFSGNDAWYHLRQVEYAVRHWPFTMSYDPWTNFPYGTNAAQFGTLYDQLVATAALVVGLGSPSSTTVAKTLLVAPAVFGALIAIPVYAVGKRLAGRVAGLFGATVLLLLPGQFLQRGLVGFADHNIAEPFFQGLAVLGLMVALAVSRRETPVWELVLDRDTDALRRPLLWSALAGVAVAVYMWVWPPGVLLVGVFGVYLVYQLTSDYVTGDSPEPVAFVGVVSMVVAALLMLVQFEEGTLSPTDFGFLQPLLAFGVAAGAAFMAGLARLFDRRDLDRTYYPVAVVGLIGVVAGVVAVALPSLFDSIASDALSFIGFSSGAGLRTISEAQPYLSPSALQQNAMTATGRIMSDYGFTLFTGVVAVIWLVAKPLVRDGETERVGYAVGSLALLGLLFLVPGPFRAVGDAVGVVSELVGVALVAAILFGAVLQTNYDAEKLLFVIWAAFMTSAAFTQIRFHYYLAPVVAVANAYLVGQILSYLDLRVSSVAALRDIQGYQVLAVLAAAMLIVTPVLLVPMGVRNTGNPQFDQSQTAWESAQSTGPGAVTEWDGSLQWMESNTPAPGTLGGADNEMEYYGSYDLTNDYDYPAGAYGVQSWWDYGHWITVRGERIPNANPFQQGATDAANYLLAPNESTAQDALGERDAEAGGTRYVMVDWQMAHPQSKFSAPVVFYDQSNVSSSDFYNPVYASNLRGNFYLRSQRYYESLMVRLYAYHGSAMEPEPVVVDWEQRRAQTQSGETITIRAGPQDGRIVRQFENVSAAQEYVAEDGTAQVGGIGHYPAERVPALEHYRLVQVSESSANASSSYQSATRRTFAVTGVPPSAQTLYEPSFVKSFEKVPGATVTASGLPANVTVRASVPVRVPTTNETFRYTQEARTTEDGELSMTLPYATTGYDEYGPSNGYTNVSVRAVGPYTIQSPLLNDNGSLAQYQTEVQIDEGRVNGDVDGARNVTLERTNPFQNLSLGGGNESGSLEPVEPVTASADDDSDGTPSPTVDDGPATQRALTAAAVARN